MVYYCRKGSFEPSLKKSSFNLLLNIKLYNIFLPLNLKMTAEMSKGMHLVKSLSFSFIRCDLSTFSTRSRLGKWVILGTQQAYEGRIHKVDF